MQQEEQRTLPFVRDANEDLNELVHIDVLCCDNEHQKTGRKYHADEKRSHNSPCREGKHSQRIIGSGMHVEGRNRISGKSIKQQTDLRVFRLRGRRGFQRCLLLRQLSIAAMQRRHGQRKRQPTQSQGWSRGATQGSVCNRQQCRPSKTKAGQ